MKVTKITEKEIRAYVEVGENAELLSIDMEKREFKYHKTNQGKSYDVKDFFESVEEWLEKVMYINGEKAVLADWWIRKNEIDFNLLQEGDDIIIRKDTQKAYLLYNNAGTEVWIPKSVVSFLNI